MPALTTAFADAGYYAGGVTIDLVAAKVVTAGVCEVVGGCETCAVVAGGRRAAGDCGTAIGIPGERRGENRIGT